MKIRSVLISLCICVLMFGVGFGATTVIRSIYGSTGNDRASFVGGGVSASGIEINEISPVPEHMPSTTVRLSPGSASGMPDKSDSMKVVKRPEPKIEIEKVDGPDFQVRSRMYVVTVHVKEQAGADKNWIYELHNDENKLISSESSSRLIVPQSQSGIYYVTVKDAETGGKSRPYEITGCIIRKMQKSRLEQICNSGDYTTMRNMEAYELSPSLVLEFTGISDEEDKAASIDDICTRISLGIWSSVSIMDIRYDDLNRVSSVEFKVNE